MKLANFLRFDPNYSGEGLTRGSRQEKEVWDLFASDPDALHTTAQAIIAASEVLGEPSSGEELMVDPEEVFPEGRVLTRLHVQRERNRDAVAKKKSSILKTAGKLACEVCDFDFAREYGSVGAGFIECHHREPLSTLNGVSKTRLSDLALVCSNCHRMLHRKPWRSVEQLRSEVHRG
jgi:5-methylcytosine-specific restriction protein A